MFICQPGQKIPLFQRAAILNKNKHHYKSLNGAYLLYISLLLVTNDIEFNPGPKATKYPCGSCGAVVRNNQNSVQCDSCNAWHHIVDVKAWA